MSRRLFTRMAARDAWRNKWRSLLMILMVALPVAAVTALDVVTKTADVQPGESLERTMGAADGRLLFQGEPIVQNGANWEDWWGSAADQNDPVTGEPKDPLAPREIGEIVGRPAQTVALRSTGTSVTTHRGRVQAVLLDSDWTSPLLEGRVRLVSGRVPAGPTEVAVNQALADKGPGPGEELVADGRRARVVGIMEDATERADPYLFGHDNPLIPAEPETELFVRTAGGIDWSDTMKLNVAGYSVASRELVAHPPSDEEVVGDFSGWDGNEDQALAVLALVITMVLIEVVLLAGPGFAVTARRMQRSLALLAVSGATPRQARRAVMAMAWVMGCAAALVGLLVGLAGAWLTLHLGQSHYGKWFAPMQIPVGDLAVVLAFGLVAALLAAAVPAWLASRQDPVATLGGRRADPPGNGLLPWVGVLLLVISCGVAVTGARQGSGGEVPIAVSAILGVLGMVLVLPWVLNAVGRTADRLPLTLRYAVRDAARHRSRTVPAIAAVAATVAGAVALNISLSSDEAQAEATYTPEFPMGMSVLHASEGKPLGPAIATVRRVVPEVEGEMVRGVNWDSPLELEPERGTDSWRRSYGGLSTSAIVGQRLPEFVDISAAERTRGNAMLASGGVVVFSDSASDARRARLLMPEKGATAESDLVPVDVPAAVLKVDPAEPTGAVMIARQQVRAWGLKTVDVGWVAANSGVTALQESEIRERLAGASNEYFVTERGYQRNPDIAIVIWSLIAAAGVLMLVGTVTSTLLSLSDAQRDLASLSAVGAEPSARRRIAIGYALVIAGIGALAGTLVGMVPGIAVSYPLTEGRFLEIPWLNMAIIVLALPLLAAAVMAAVTRSRLPMLERAD